MKLNEMPNPRTAKLAVTAEDRERKAAQASAVKADFKRSINDLHMVNLLEHLKSCYNEYRENGDSLGLPRDVRNSYADRAAAYDDIIKYIDRQAK